MTFSVAKNVCHSCQHRSKVYFLDGSAPNIGEVYRYLCPGCGQVIYFRPDTGTVIVNNDESIPEGATLVEKKELH